MVRRDLTHRRGREFADVSGHGYGNRAVAGGEADAGRGCRRNKEEAAEHEAAVMDG